MKHPVVVVTVDIGGRKLSLDARIYTLTVDCGCWGHSYNVARVVEVAISPAGHPLGMRTRTDQPFTASVKAGPVGALIDNTETLVQQEQRDHADALKNIERIKQKQLDLQEQQETQGKKKRK